MATSVRAADVDWKTEGDFHKALATVTGFSGKDRPLREGLRAISRETQVAIFLDRRIDPDQRVDFTTRDLSLQAALEKLALNVNAAIAVIDDIVYIGPPPVASRLAASAAQRRRELSRLPEDERRAWLIERDFAWRDLAEPRSIAEAIAKRVGKEIANPELIPHDLWASWHGPATDSISQLTIVLAGFDLTCRLGANDQIKLEAVATEKSYEHSYAITGDATQIGQRIKKLLPDVKLRRDGPGRIAVTAEAADHAKIAEFLAGKPAAGKAKVVPGKKLYTFTANNEPLGAIVKTIATDLGVEVRGDQAVAEKLKARTSANVKQAEVEELLHKVLDPAGIEFKITEKTLELSITK